MAGGDVISDGGFSLTAGVVGGGVGVGGGGVGALGGRTFASVAGELTATCVTLG